MVIGFTNEKQNEVPETKETAKTTAKAKPAARAPMEDGKLLQLLLTQKDMRLMVKSEKMVKQMQKLHEEIDYITKAREAIANRDLEWLYGYYFAKHFE